MRIDIGSSFEAQEFLVKLIFSGKFLRFRRTDIDSSSSSRISSIRLEITEFPDYRLTDDQFEFF